MGNVKVKGATPLSSGQLLTIFGKTVELDSEVLRHEVPRITGSMPFDGQVNVDDDPSRVDEAIVTGDFPMDDPEPMTVSVKSNASFPILQMPMPASEGVTKKFVPPTNFYSKPFTSEKGPLPLFVFVRLREAIGY